MNDRPFRFALQGTASGDPELVRTSAVTAESLGYVEFWSSDHIGAADPFRFDGALGDKPGDWTVDFPPNPSWTSPRRAQC